MALKPCNWNRFWCARDGTFFLDLYGFPVEPSRELPRLVPPNVMVADELATIPCLVLLGEPGSGKSYEMRCLKALEAAGGASSSARAELIDLRLYSSGSEVRQQIFGAPWFQEWEQGTSELHIFLDSLDECRTHVTNVTAILADEIEKRRANCGRLRLRIACRTADWPEVFGQQIIACWGEEASKILEITPLTRRNVHDAAAAHGVDAEAFVSAVIQRGVQPLAMRPITLEQLLNIFRKTGSLPSRLLDIYEQGLALLCDETEERLESTPRRYLSASQRLSVATRIGAALVLGNRYAVHKGVDLGTVDESDVRVADLVGGEEGPDADRIQVDEPAIQDTLNSGLFTSRGVHRMAFAHQTYGEFLAARYLTHHEFSLAQIRQVIGVPDEASFRIAPQLAEAAAWLASFRADVFAEILRHEPEVLLRSDVVEETERAELAGALLHRLACEVIPNWRELRPYLKRLRHPALVQQLASIVSNPKADPRLRMAAIDIAEDCKCSDLTAQLVAVATSKQEPHRVRVDAAYAIVRTGTAEGKKQLSALLVELGDDDPDDELRGCALRAGWPDHLTASQVVTFLTNKRSSFFGAYRTFLADAFLDHLAAADLPLVLRWMRELQRQPDPQDAFDPFWKMAERLLTRALDNIDDPVVARELALFCTRRIKETRRLGFSMDSRDSDFARRIGEDIDARRGLVAAIVSLPAESEVLERCGQAYPSLIVREDVGWMVDQALANSAQETAWAKLLAFAYDWSDPIHLEIVYSARRQSKAIDEALRDSPEHIDLDSDRARSLRVAHAQFRDLHEEIERSQPQPLDPPPAQRVARLLDRCLTEDIELFWRLNMELTLEPLSVQYGSDYNPDLQSMPGWRDGDLATRSRIVEACRRYVSHHRPKSENWITSNIFYRPDAAGYRALRLLLALDREFIQQLAAEVWAQWALVVIAFPLVQRSRDDSVPDRQLVEEAYRRAPAEFIEALLRLVDRDNEKSDHLSVLRDVEHCADERLGRALLDRFRLGGLKPTCAGELLSLAMTANKPEARGVAEAHVSNPPPGDRVQRDLSLEAARCLVAGTQDAGWDTIWPVVKSDRDWAKALFEMLCHAHEHESFVNKLTDSQVGDLLDWLMTHYPPVADPEHSGVHQVTPDESVRSWRNRVLAHLQERGTVTAVQQLGRLAIAHPELTGMENVIALADHARRRRAWVATSPKQLFEMAYDREKRFVESGRQLLDVLTESLDRLAAKLHGETPRIDALWDRPSGVCQPKEEASLANFIKGHLDDDLRGRGIVVNREVEIRVRLSPAGAAGQRIDILVDAINPGTPDVINSIGEVKGCWNRELTTAMETQVEERYLHENEARCGLYLVGWYLCNAWLGEADYRKAETPFGSLDECRGTLDAQARSVTARSSSLGGEVRAYILDCAIR